MQVSAFTPSPGSSNKAEPQVSMLWVFTFFKNNQVDTFIIKQTLLKSIDAFLLVLISFLLFFYIFTHVSLGQISVIKGKELSLNSWICSQVISLTLFWIEPHAFCNSFEDAFLLGMQTLIIYSFHSPSHLGFFYISRVWSIYTKLNIIANEYLLLWHLVVAE